MSENLLRVLAITLSMTRSTREDGIPNDADKSRTENPFILISIILMPVPPAICLI